MPKRDPKLVQLSKSLHTAMESEGVDMDEATFMGILYTKFSSLTDDREQGKVKHKLSDCIGIVLFCSFSGIDEWIEMEEFAYENQQILAKYLCLSNGIPSHDTLQRVMAIIRPEQLQETLIQVLRETITKASKEIDECLYKNPDLDLVVTDVVAIDGKETRNTAVKDAVLEKDQRNFNMLNVYSTETGITLSSTRIPEKTNEIPEAQFVLKKLDLTGCVVTADAMNTQKETARIIVENAHADYCLAVKSNQQGMYNDLVQYFEDPSLLKEIEEKHPERRYKIVETSKNKEVVREHYITDDIKWFEDLDKWAKLKTFGYIKKTVRNTKSGEETVEKRYYICSFKPDVKLLALVIRRHWHVENLLHWCLDVVFKEDSLRTKEKKALQNLSLIKQFTLSIIKVLKSHYRNLSMNHIRRKMGRNFEKEIPVVFVALKKLYEMGGI